MAEQIIRIFVSCPDDVGPEREAVDRVVADLNARLGGAPLMKTVRRETSFYSARSTARDQAPDPAKCDLALTLFWTRLGSEPPPDFEKQRDGKSWPSATVFEMARALEANRASNGATPAVLVYRKTKDLPLPTENLSKRRETLAEFQRFAIFWHNWFVARQRPFKTAFKTFVELDPFETMLKADLLDWLRARGHLRGDTRWDIALRGSPFRGLQQFEAEHSEVFFGRAHAIERGLRALRDATARKTPFLLVAGDSGVGKSSLARAGLLPRLTRPGIVADVEMWRVCAFDFSAGDVFETLAEALFSALPELSEGDFSTASALAGHFARGGGPEPVLGALSRAAKNFGGQENFGVQDGLERAPCARLALLADRMERLFLLPAPRRDAMAALLAALVKTGAVFVIATLRIDALGAFLALEVFKPLAELGGRLDLSPPGADEIGDMVRGPAQAAGLTYERDSGGGLDDTIVEAARGLDDVLPLLQFALEELFRARDGDTLTKAAYAALGGLEGDIGRQAERAFSTLPDEAKARLPRLLRALVETGKGGLALVAAPRENLETTPGDQGLIAALLEARILVAGGGAQGATVRLAHEAVLRSWRETGRRSKEDEPGDRPIPPPAVRKPAQDLVRDRGDKIDADKKGLVAASTRPAEKRRQIGLIAATGVFALAATVSGFMFWQASRRAEASLTAARTALQSVSANVARGLRGATGMTNEKLDAALGELRGPIDQLAKSAPDDLALMQLRAAMLSEIGLTQAMAGDFDGALKSYRDALALIERQLARNPDDPARWREASAARDQIGNALLDKGDVAGAIKMFRESLANSESASVKFPGDLGLLQQRSLDHSRIGKALEAQRDFGAALAEFEQSLALAQVVASKNPDDRAARIAVSLAHSRVGSALQSRNDLSGALASYRKALEGGEADAKANASDANAQHNLVVSLGDIGGVLAAQGDHPGAREALVRARGIAQKLASAEPGELQWQRDIGDIEIKIGDAAAAAKNLDEAGRAYAASADMREKIAGSDPNNAARQSEFADALGKVATIKESQGDRASSRAAYTKSLTIYEKIYARDLNGKDARENLADTLNMLADIADEFGDKAQAAKYRERAAAAKAGN